MKLSVKRFSDGASLNPSLPTGRFGGQAGTAPSYALATIAGVPSSPNFEFVEKATAGFGELTFKARVILDCAVEAR